MPHLRSPGRRAAIAAAACLPLLATVVALPGSAAAAGNPDSEALRAAVSAAGIFTHLTEFQRIADANGGVRVSGSKGYDDSADYVERTVRAAGYAVTRQYFDFPFFSENAPAALTRLTPAPDKEYEEATATYSGSGTASGAVTPVDLSLTPPRASTSGCEAADFAGFPAGNIALVQRGTCTFEDKVANAQLARASAVVLFNQGNTEARSGPLGAITLGRPFTIPVVSVNFADGAELAAAGTTARVVTSTTSETRQTSNIIAESRTGDAENVVMQGAHLDSVEEGPGIQDNGTGSAALLELAVRAKDLPTINRTRFAWWGAEESGLLGSEYYVEQLSAEARDDISLYLNYDMIGSPNFVRFVYNGDNSADAPSAGVIPAGSAQIEKDFLDYFGSQGLVTDATAFDGRSDYGPFIAVGIAAGGLFTGAEGIKTADQAARYGGTAGVAYDPNYHQVGDTINNVNREVLEQNADAIADAFIRYGASTTAVDNVGALAYGLTETDQITTFRTDTPDSVLSTLDVDLVGTEDLVGIDVRPATGQLYGVVDGATDRVVVIDPATGDVTASRTLSVPLRGTQFGVDFNPVVDRLRIVSDANQNLRVNVADGLVAVDTDLANAAGGTRAGQDPDVRGAAYTGSVLGATATATVLYDLDIAGADRLVRQDPPNAGTLVAVGDTGTDVASTATVTTTTATTSTAEVGFDIGSDGAAYAVLFDAETSEDESLYRIDLTTGAATLVGAFGTSSRVQDIALALAAAPAPPGGGTPGVPGTPVTPAPTATASPSGTASPTPSGSPSPGGSASPTANPACAVPTTITLPRTTITATSAAQVVVRTAPNSIVDLFAYTRPSTTYRVVRSAEVNASGTTTFTVVPPANTRLYAQQRGCTAGPSVVLSVRTALSISAQRNGRLSYTFRGDSLPARRGGLIVSVYSVGRNGAATLLGQTRANARTGDWSLRLRFARSGVYGIVARTGADLQNAPGTSNVRRTLVY